MSTEATPMTAIPPVRLVLTHSRTMWHVAQPQTPYYALCGIQSRPPRGDRPTTSKVCRRCERAYECEVAR